MTKISPNHASPLTFGSPIGAVRPQSGWLQFAGRCRATDGSQHYQSFLQKLMDGLKSLNLDVEKVRYALQQLVLRVVSELQNIGRLLGLNFERKTPRMAVTDSYTVAAHEFIHRDAQDASTYQITFRRRPKWMNDIGIPKDDSRFVLYGLQRFVQQFLQNPITMAEIEEADRFFKTARPGGKPLNWDRRLWERVVTEKNGIIPIKIQSLPEGSTFFPGEPVVQISAEEGFGELAAWFETKIIQIWAGTEVATMSRHWLEYNEKMIRETGDKNLSESDIKALAQRMTLDFSDRSSASPEDSEQLGMAWLTSHKATSTLGAAYQAWAANREKPGAASASMKSLAHRVVQASPNEEDVYKQLYHASTANGEWGSYVADCYDFRRAVTDYLIPLAQQAQAENTGGVVCARPDSGDRYEQIRFVLDEAVKNGLYETIETRDGKLLKAMTTLRVIQADGMNFTEIHRINKKLIEDGFSPAHCVYYGVGGFLRNEISRDSASVAMKLSEVGAEHRPVMKFAPESPGKASTPGANKIVREAGMPSVRYPNEPGDNALITYYDGTDSAADAGVQYQEDFDAIQERVATSVDTPKPGSEILSKAILETKDALHKQFVEQVPV